MMGPNFTIRSALKKLVFQCVYNFEATRQHPLRVLLLRAKERAIVYIEKNMTSAIGLVTEKEILEWCLGEVGVNGAYLEFGVYKGGSISWMARCRPGLHFHGFDSFEGLPENWAGYNQCKGAFAINRLPKVPPNVTLHKGWFEHTLPAWLSSHPDKVAFVHVDCDLYSSTVTVLEQLQRAGRFQEGSVILFDEYLGYPNWEMHEFKAWQEFVSAYDVDYEYIAFSREQVAVRIRRIGKAAGAQ